MLFFGCVLREFICFLWGNNLFSSFKLGKKCSESYNCINQFCSYYTEFCELSASYPFVGAY